MLLGVAVGVSGSGCVVGEVVVLPPLIGEAVGDSGAGFAEGKTVVSPSGVAVGESGSASGFSIFDESMTPGQSGRSVGSCCSDDEDEEGWIGSSIKKVSIQKLLSR